MQSRHRPPARRFARANVGRPVSSTRPPLRNAGQSQFPVPCRPCLRSAAAKSSQFSPETELSKEPRLARAEAMLLIEQVVDHLSLLDNSQMCVWQLHFTRPVKRRLPRQCEKPLQFLPWRYQSIKRADVFSCSDCVPVREAASSAKRFSASLSRSRKCSEHAIHSEADLGTSTFPRTSKLASSATKAAWSALE